MARGDRYVKPKQDNTNKKVSTINILLSIIAVAIVVYGIYGYSSSFGGTKLRVIIILIGQLVVALLFLVNGLRSLFKSQDKYMAGVLLLGCVGIVLLTVVTLVGIIF